MHAIDNILDTPTTPLPISTDYASFWQRILATLIDAIIVMAFFFITTLLCLWFNGPSRLQEIISTVSVLAFVLFYNVFLVGRLSATPGKMVMRLKIIKKDGTDISREHAVMRYAVVLAANLYMCIPGLMALSFLDQSTLSHTLWIREYFEVYGVRINIPQTACVLWYLPALFFLVFQAQRRVPHDFIAGTVVIRRPR